jgi:hypothetical protein
MASASWSLTRGTLIDNVASSGSQTVTEGVLAPGVGDLEIRVDLTKNLTKKEIRQAIETIWRFIKNNNNSTSVPL